MSEACARHQRGIFVTLVAFLVLTPMLHLLLPLSQPPPIPDRILTPMHPTILHMLHGKSHGYTPDEDYQAVGTDRPSRTPQKVAFLFLTTSRFPFEPMWDEYLSRNFSHMYTVYIHTKPDAAVAMGARFRARIIPSVSSSWGENLVDAQIQLLFYALSDPRNAYFVFLSDSTIPLKPLHVVHDAIVGMKGRSAFCICPWEQALFAYSKLTPNVTQLFPQIHHHWRKADMWSILHRTHAQFFTHQALDIHRISLLMNTDADELILAPDEYVFVSLLLREGKQKEIVDFYRVQPRNKVHQGACPTYFFWDDFSEEHGQYKAAPHLADCEIEDNPSRWRRAAASLAATSASMTPPNRARALARLTPALCSDQKPYTFVRVSEDDLDTLIHYPSLLFARKFQENASVLLTSTRCGRIGEALPIHAFLRCRFP